MHSDFENVNRYDYELIIGPNSEQYQKVVLYISTICRIRVFALEGFSIMITSKGYHEVVKGR